LKTIFTIVYSEEEKSIQCIGNCNLKTVLDLVQQLIIEEAIKKSKEENIPVVE